MTPRAESGQTTVLVLGLALLTFAIAGLAIDGTRAFIFRRTLQSAADAASVAAASELDRDAYYKSGGRTRVLDPELARAAASRWITLRGIGSRAGISVSDERVVIVMRDRVPTMFLRLVGISSVPVAVNSVAEPRARAPSG